MARAYEATVTVANALNRVETHVLRDLVTGMLFKDHTGHWMWGGDWGTLKKVQGFPQPERSLPDICPSEELQEVHDAFIEQIRF